MRIVYNLRDQNWETTKSLGVLHVSLRILEGLAGLPGIGRIDVLANRSLAALLPASPDAARVCRHHFVETAAPTGWARLLWDQWALVRRTNALAPDWLLLPKGFAPLVRWPRARVSAYVHDNVFDYYRRAGGSPFPAGEAAYFSRGLARTAARADLIVTNSDFTAGEIAAGCRPRRRPVRIGAPVTTAPAPAGGVDGGGALLLLTSAWPHKLTAQAIAWLQRWEDDTASRRPVRAVGSLPAGMAWPARAGWSHFPRADEAAYGRLLAESNVLIYFSAYEGYGLPPVEAASAGVRAIASDLPPLRETMPAACLFANAGYSSFRDTLNRALASPPAAPLRLDLPGQVAARWQEELRRAG
jgi:hypothetical protein